MEMHLLEKFICFRVGHLYGSLFFQISKRILAE
jgi:hypothetical protein